MQRAASPPVVEGAPSPGPLPDPRASRSFTGLCARREGAERHKSRSPTTPRPLQDPGEVTAPFPIQRLHSPRRLRRPEVRSTPFAACPGSRGLSLPSALRAGQGRNVKQAGLRPERFLSAPRGKVRFGHCPALSAPPPAGRGPSSALPLAARLLLPQPSPSQAQGPLRHPPRGPAGSDLQPLPMHLAEFTAGEGRGRPCTSCVGGGGGADLCISFPTARLPLRIGECRPPQGSSHTGVPSSRRAPTPKRSQNPAWARPPTEPQVASQPERSR